MIRKATLQDLDQLTLLFDKYLVFYKRPSNIEKQKLFLKERIENNEAIIYIAFDEKIKDKAIGFTLIYITFSSLLLNKMIILNDLYVDSSIRKSGVGEKLILQSFKLAKELGVDLVRLRTAKNNIIAQSLYLKMGFERDKLSYTFDYLIK
ncbi:GNAT family N-acetyltransferase [Flavobacterium cellulosilyticum]|uniref:GNAT family N-acetyltransferase n=1 Tax=Flavobacterium cellulosilyticum TaxID=2541731 RepID=A0A4R5CD72_9FLAO|nr:GNAT family N-acetyltransferase [Flavobacterium cellulosilyticum]TDD97425.1 GNAT family N-acetyltransferase [Flavobacterium cellulosilyticum]